MNGLPGPRALLLDALGTLVELQPPAPRLRAELAGRFGADVSLAEAQAAIAAEIGYYRAHLNAGRDAESLAELRLRCAQALRDALPSPVRAGLPEARSLVDALLASLQFDPFPDAVRALPRLRAEGRRLVVVSNWDVSLHEVLERVGIARAVDAVVTSAEVGARKPDAAIFERALALADASAGQALHVGDSLTEDVEGARAAGIDAILLRRDGGAGPAGVRTIASLERLVLRAAAWDRAGSIVRAMDEGAPIAYQVLDEGVPVYSSDGQELGTVEHVIAAPSEDIFHGVVMRTPLGRRFIAGDQISSLHERGVDLGIDAEEAAGLPEPGGGSAPAWQVHEPGVKPTPWQGLVDMVTGAGRHRREWDKED